MDFALLFIVILSIWTLILTIWTMARARETSRARGKKNEKQICKCSPLCMKRLTIPTIRLHFRSNIFSSLLLLYCKKNKNDTINKQKRKGKSC